MESFFNSLDEALAYGYELKSSVPHRDVTVSGWGYDLNADDGRVAVPVNTGELTLLEKGHGKTGKGSRIRMMFPPRGAM